MKIFAILVMIEKPVYIESFIQRGISDTDLPLSVEPVDESEEPQRDHPRSIPRECLERWSDLKRRGFKERQWSMIAPVFGRGERKNIPHCKFQPDRILPFTAFDKPTAEGGCGQVHKVRIHPDHHLFNDFGVSPAPKPHCIAFISAFECRFEARC